MAKQKVAILGCTGIVGQQFIRILQNHPYFEVTEIFASERSAGKTYEEAAIWSVIGVIPEKIRKMKIKALSVKNILDTKVKILFSGIPASIAKGLETDLRKEGRYIFTNASSYRMDEDVPILIPEINHEQIELAAIQKKKYSGFIIAGSNCSTAGLVMPLKPLMQFGIQEVVVNTFQAISGAGRKGIYAMDIHGNVIPYIGSEEEKMMKETVKILGVVKNNKIENSKINVIANCCRVPVFDGHTESLVIKFKNKIDLEKIKDALVNFRGEPQNLKLPTAPVEPLILKNEINRPQPLFDVLNGEPERARGMAVTVGRLRVDGKVLRMFLLVHNTIRGASGNCILNAEFALKKNLID